MTFNPQVSRELSMWTSSPRCTVHLAFLYPAQSAKLLGLPHVCPIAGLELHRSPAARWKRKRRRTENEMNEKRSAKKGVKE
jgi:hypothetical protein